MSDRASVILRIGNPEVLADVAALATLRFRWRTEEAGESGDPEAFTTRFAEWWLTHASSHLGFIAESGDEPVGMAWLGILTRVPGPEQFVRLAGMVQSVYVVPGARGAGVGRELVDAVITEARTRGLSYLGVHPSQRSYPLYERAGFAETPAILELGLTGDLDLRLRRSGHRASGRAC